MTGEFPKLEAGLRFISTTLPDAVGERLEVAMSIDAELVTLRLAGLTQAECARALGCRPGAACRREAKVLEGLRALHRREDRRITADLCRMGQARPRATRRLAG